MAIDEGHIGVFDSGVGGLSVLKNLRDILPYESFLYFSDSGNFPYGTKNKIELISLSRRIIDHFLKNYTIKVIVVACGTVSSTCLDDLQELYPSLPIFGTLASTYLNNFVQNDPHGTIGVFGTDATISSPFFSKKLLGDFCFLTQACPLFASFVELEFIQNTNLAESMVRHYSELLITQSVLKMREYRSIILGCTHFSFLKKTFIKCYPGIDYIDPGVDLSIVLSKYLADKKMLASTCGAKIGSVEFLND